MDNKYRVLSFFLSGTGRLTKMPASHWWRKEKGKRERGAGAPFSLNLDQNSFHFHDLPSFERFSDSQTEQART